MDPKVMAEVVVRDALVSYIAGASYEDGAFDEACADVLLRMLNEDRIDLNDAILITQEVHDFIDKHEVHDLSESDLHQR